VSDEELTERQRVAAGHVNGRQPRLSERPAGVPPADGPGPEDDPDEVIWKRHRPPVFLRPRLMIFALAVLVAGGALFFSHRQGSWPPPADCGHTAIKGNVGHVRTGYPLYWAATGPDQQQYAITLGASAVKLDGGTLTVTAAESNGAGKALVVRQPATLSGCRVNGHLTMPLAYGEYSLRLWRVDGATATQVAKARVDSDG
jgi:hypothetical protein